MRLFGFRITTWLMFGIGFLLGSRAGNEPWQRAVQFWNDFRGEGSGDQMGNGQVKETARKTPARETAGSTG